MIIYKKPFLLALATLFSRKPLPVRATEGWTPGLRRSLTELIPGLPIPEPITETYYTNEQNVVTNSTQWDLLKQSECANQNYALSLYVHHHLVLVAYPMHDEEHNVTLTASFCPVLAFHHPIRLNDQEDLVSKQVLAFKSASEVVQSAIELLPLLDSVPLSKIALAFDEAEAPTGKYSLLELNCAAFILNMAKELSIPVSKTVVAHVVKSFVEKGSAQWFRQFNPGFDASMQSLEEKVLFRKNDGLRDADARLSDKDSNTTREYVMLDILVKYYIETHERSYMENKDRIAAFSNYIEDTVKEMHPNHPLPQLNRYLDGVSQLMDEDERRSAGGTIAGNASSFVPETSDRTSSRKLRGNSGGTQIRCKLNTPQLKNMYVFGANFTTTGAGEVFFSTTCFDEDYPTDETRPSEAYFEHISDSVSVPSEAEAEPELMFSGAGEHSIVQALACPRDKQLKIEVKSDDDKILEKVTLYSTSCAGSLTKVNAYAPNGAVLEAKDYHTRNSDEEFIWSFGNGVDPTTSYLEVFCLDLICPTS